MPRRVQDIVPNDRRSIRDIPVENKAGPSREKTASEKTRQTDSVASKHSGSRQEATRNGEREIPIKRILLTPPPPRKKKSRKGGKWVLIVLGIIVIVAGAGVIASVYFSRATFTIVPKTIPVAVNTTLVAQVVPQNGALAYQLVTVHASASSTVPAVSGAAISTKAQGNVTIYNAYSTQTQRLVAGTRLANDSGLVYRLSGSVTVPGYTVSKSTGNNLPGSVSATIVADQPGDTYNISRASSISDFKILGFQGTPKYADFYARLSSDVNGGFVGTKKVVAPAALASSTAALKSQLTAALAKQAASAVPDGYILYDANVVTSFAAPVIGGANTNNATISLAGTANGIIFKKSELIARLAGDSALTSFGNFAYTASGLDSLTMNVANVKDFSPDKKTTLVIHAQGNMKLIGTVPVAEIKRKLAGISLSATQAVFDSYRSVIESGSGELVPPWAHVPTDLSHISVVLY